MPRSPLPVNVESRSVNRRTRRSWPVCPAQMLRRCVLNPWGFCGRLSTNLLSTDWLTLSRAETRSAWLPQARRRRWVTGAYAQSRRSQLELRLIESVHATNISAQLVELRSSSSTICINRQIQYFRPLGSVHSLYIMKVMVHLAGSDHLDI